MGVRSASLRRTRLDEGKCGELGTYGVRRADVAALVEDEMLIRLKPYTAERK